MYVSDGSTATVTTPIPAQELPPSPTTAGPSRAVNKQKAENALLSIHSDDDDMQQVSKVKGGNHGIQGPTATGRSNQKRKQVDDPQSEHETKKRRNSGLEEQVEEVLPPAAAKRDHVSSRKVTSRSGKGEGTINETAGGEGKTKAKTVSVIDLNQVELLDIEEDARAEAENLASLTNSSRRLPKQGNTQTKQSFSWGRDDECARLHDQLQQVRFLWSNCPTCILFDSLV